MLPKLALIVLGAALVLPSAGSFGLNESAPAALAEGVLADEIVIGFAGAIPADVGAWLQARGGAEVLRDEVLGFVAAKFPSQALADRAILAAQQRADVRYAQHDGLVRVQLTPNDPLYGQQWGYPAVFAPQAWDVTLGSKSAKVAILDTGVKGNHVDLAANICGPHASFVPGELPLVDGFGHGTHVAGTVAAVTNNGVGVSGMSQSCLMDVKVLSSGGSGQWTWVAAGIRWAADNGAHIISMSLGGSASPGAVMEDAVRYAYNTKNVLVVAAAGNSGCNAGNAPPMSGVPVPRVQNDLTMLWPARYDEVLAVAALAPSDGLGTAGFSSCGSDMEISAPGAGVLSTMDPVSLLGRLVCSGSSYCVLDGTSMATPHVSGAAALVKSQNPAITAVQLRCLLDLSADDLLDSNRDPIAGRDYSTGWGKLNPLKALQMDTSLRSSGGYAAFTQACTSGAPVITN